MEHQTAFTNNEGMVSTRTQTGNTQAHDVRGLATKNQNKSELPAYELTVLDHSIF